MLKKYQLRYYNFRLVALLLVTSTLGVMIINSANSSYTIKQIMGIGIGLVGMLIISLIDYNWLARHYILIYTVNLVLLVLVNLFGKKVGGARRWLGLSDSLSIQPSEFAKIFLIVFTAKVICMFKDRLNTWRFLAILALLLALPIGLVYKQPNLSTTLLICMVMFTIMYCAGLSYRIIGILICAAVVMGGIIFVDIHQENPIILKKYQVSRIMSFVQDDANDTKGLEQQDYSVQAIGSGQLNGKGLNNTDSTSVKNGDYIPEVQTDFIFAVVGEELGFIGGCIILLLLGLIVLECIIAAIKAKDFCGRLICCGMAALLAYQTFINIGVATQVLPNTGVPLPFISCGLSSLVALFGGLGIVINVSLQRNSYDND